MHHRAFHSIKSESHKVSFFIKGSTHFKVA